MKNLLYIILITIGCSSCSSTYFFSTLASSNREMEQVENGDFLIQNDSLWIAYCFNGEDAPVMITVFNKSREPLYVDWQRSALIINETPFSYTGERVMIDGMGVGSTSVSDYSVYYNIHGEMQASFGGGRNLSKTTSFIPPNTKISHNPLSLTNIDFTHIPDKDYQKAAMVDNDDKTVRVSRLDFDERNTPLKFKSYLTIYAADQKPMVYEHEFYLKNLIKSKELTPKSMTSDLSDRGDLFYITKPANTTAIEIILGTVIVAGAVAVDVMLDSDDGHYHH